MDDRFQLHIKSKMTWEYPWIWARAEEQEHCREVCARINTSPLLRGAVQLDGFGGDVAAWLRKIGFVLSTSDDESFHLAPAEGMASRALPMLLPWKGADAIYPGEWIHADDDEIAAAILDDRRPVRLGGEGRGGPRLHRLALLGRARVRGVGGAGGVDRGLLSPERSAPMV